MVLLCEFLKHFTSESKVLNETHSFTYKVIFYSLYMGAATIYAETNLHTLMNQNYGMFYPSSEAFLMIRIQKVCVEKQF